MADQDEKAVEEKLAARKVHFETLFDDFQGKNNNLLFPHCFK